MNYTRVQQSLIHGVAVIASVSLLFFAFPAEAEHRVLPEKTVIKLPTVEGETTELIVLSEPHFLIDRDAINQANKSALLNKELELSLLDCEKRRLVCTPKEPSTILVAAKWGAVGAIVVGAFVLGLAVAR